MKIHSFIYRLRPHAPGALGRSSSSSSESTSPYSHIPTRSRRARLRVHQNFRGGIFSNPPLQSSQPGGDHPRVDALHRPVIGIVPGVVVSAGVGVDAEGDAPLGLRVGVPRRIRNPVVDKTRRQTDCPYVREIQIEIEIEIEIDSPPASIDPGIHGPDGDQSAE